MTHMKKQMKITRLFRRQTAQLPEDCEDLQEEIQQLEQQVKAKHDELFDLQRNSHRQRLTDDYISKKSAVVKGSQPFTRPEKIILSNSVESLKREIELMSLLSGVEVQSYTVDKECTVAYHMQQPSEHQITHGIKIDMTSGNEVSSSCLPLGFNLDAVLEQFDNVMLPGCLGAVRKALAAYYDRLDQFNKLKKLLHNEGDLFRVLDGSHMQVKFAVRSQHEAPEEQIGVTLMLDYRVYDIRPKQISFVDIELPDGSVETLSQQCAVFKRKSLHKAFKDAFIDGIGPYTMVLQSGVPRAYRSRHKNKRARPNNPYNHHDDTFHPEDCSSEEDVEE